MRFRGPTRVIATFSLSVLVWWWWLSTLRRGLEFDQSVLLSTVRAPGGALSCAGSCWTVRGTPFPSVVFSGVFAFLPSKCLQTQVLLDDSRLFGLKCPTATVQVRNTPSCHPHLPFHLGMAFATAYGFIFHSLSLSVYVCMCVRVRVYVFTRVCMRVSVQTNKHTYVCVGVSWHVALLLPVESTGPGGRRILC